MRRHYDDVAGIFAWRFPGTRCVHLGRVFCCAAYTASHSKNYILSLALGWAVFFTMSALDMENPEAPAIRKTHFQVGRDAFLFATVTCIIFGPCWFGVSTLVLALRDDGTESAFALASCVSALTCAFSHELLFQLLPFIKVKWGGYIEYTWAEGLAGSKALGLSHVLYDIGGVVVLGIPEAAIAMFSPTENEVANVLRVTASFFLGFGMWGLFMELFNLKFGYRQAVKKESVSVSGGSILLRSFLAKFCDVVAVNYFGRFVAKALVKVMRPSALARFVEAFVKNAFFIVTWFFSLRCVLVDTDFDWRLCNE